MAPPKKTRQKDKNAGVNALLKMVESPRTITVRGQKLTPQRPDKVALLNMRRVQGENMRVAQQIEEKTATMEDVIRANFDLSVTAIMGCFPDLSEDDAANLMTLSGGEGGELAQYCLELHGIDKVTAEQVEQAMANGQLDMSFLLQGPLEKA